MESPIIAKLPRGHRMERRFGVVFDSVPEFSDDLTRVEGVLTREAVILNQLGIYFWGQMAMWRHREMSAIADELQVPVGRMIDEGWTEQAKNLCSTVAPRQSATLPASPLRTTSLLVVALIIGCCSVYLLGGDRNEPLTGILSADMTTIRVPAASRLTSLQVKAGEEVFSGQLLLTLEKLEHLTIIESQTHLVRDLEREVKRVEAQATIELDWRTRDLNRELSNVRQRVALRELAGSTASRVPDATPHRAHHGLPVRSVSSSNAALLNSALRGQAGGIIFFSGAGGQASAGSEPARVPDIPQPMQRAQIRPDALVADAAIISGEDADLQTLRAEQSRLEVVRTTLSAIVKEAVGATTIQAEYLEASQKLESLKTVSREVIVHCPVYGTVGQVRYRIGDDMQTGEVMLRILHPDRRYVTAYLPTRRVYELRLGQEVELQFPGNQEFRGQVVDIPLVADVIGHTGDTQAAVRIEPVGRLWPYVPVGSQIDVISSR